MEFIVGAGSADYWLGAGLAINRLQARLLAGTVSGSDPGQVVHTQRASVIKQCNLVMLCCWEGESSRFTSSPVRGSQFANYQYPTDPLGRQP